MVPNMSETQLPDELCPMCEKELLTNITWKIPIWLKSVRQAIPNSRRRFFIAPTQYCLPDTIYDSC